MIWIKAKQFTFIALFLCALFIGCKQQAQNTDSAYDEAISLLEAHDFDGAYKRIVVLAENGHAKAQYDLGWMYYSGNGVTQNADKAMEWYMIAAESGEPMGMAAVGSGYLNGMFGKVDCKEGIKWLEKAVMEGDLGAARVLSIVYSDGRCVEKKPSLALKYINDYKKLGFGSDFYLGDMYFWGYGVEEDRFKGVKLMESDYESNVPRGGYVLGVAYLNGFGVDKDPHKAFKFFRESAQAGNSSAQYNLGILYYNGKGVETNKAEALYWINKAARVNHFEALSFIGYLYEVGEIYEKDVVKALEYYEKASQLGSETAMKRLEALQQ